jgi:hypothetical protein
VDNINHHKQNNFKVLNALFKVVHHYKETWPGNYPVLQDIELGWIISDKIHLAAPDMLQGKVTLFAITA